MSQEHLYETVLSKSFFLGLLANMLFCMSTINVTAQQTAIERFINDPALTNASISYTFINTETGEVVYEYDSHRTLSPASTQKLITSAVAVELLEPDHTFKTSLGLIGNVDENTGTLNGDVIIKGGGDPTLMSKRFSKFYGDIFGKWTTAIKNAGITNINGRVITDDSYFDYMPVPATWMFEDLGNYYGAGVYGLSLYDNTFEIHFKTGEEGSSPEVLNFSPSAYKINLVNRLTSAGTTDNGYIFTMPYNTSGWIEGAIPANRPNFVLKGAITDPPLLAAQMLTNALKSAGIKVSKKPSTQRVENISFPDTLQILSVVSSPTLEQIAKILNHESVNLYAETLLKEISKENENIGSTELGIEVITSFLELAGIDPNEVKLKDGSGLSPMNSVSSYAIATLLSYMTTSDNYEQFLSTLATPNSEGTIKGLFTDPVFQNTLKIKSGSMSGSRSYAGYLTGEEKATLSFCIIVNNYNGTSSHVISSIEELLKEIVLSNIFNIL